jgi:vanillate O-demethylase monooxygenase subunit
MTPETAKTTHYFFAATRNYKVDDEDLNRRLAATRERIFATEDKPMIESVQRKMGDREFWSMKPIVMPIDVGPARVRRRLQKMIEAEQGASATRTE